MKFEIISSQGNRRLLLIYGGWSTSGEMYRHVRKPGWDIALVTGIDTEGIDEVRLQIAEYPTIYLFAWSLGVFASELLFEGIQPPAAAFAVNGTSMPSDDLTGIPEAIFRGTREGLSEASLQKFRRRMFASGADFKAAADLFPEQADTEALRAQLLFAETTAAGAPITWNKAFIADGDRIIPSEAQSRFWAMRRVETEHLDSPHYVDIQTIIDRCIVDTGKIGRLFTRSAETYNTNAVAQKMIALRLADAVRMTLTRHKRGINTDSLNPSTEGVLYDDMRLNVRNMLEIGCGNGLLTYALARFLDAGEAVFADLCPCGPFSVSGNERYLQCDAELYAAQQASGTESERFELICSSSAIQWFSDIPSFLANCGRLLSADGLLAMATFAPGNLTELQSVRKSDLRYPEPAKIEGVLREKFAHAKVWTDTIVLEFDSALELLRHLKLTGVTATAGEPLSPSSVRQLARKLPQNAAGKYTLTFTPLYFLASQGMNFQ